MPLRTPTNERIVSRKTNTSDVDRKDTSIKITLFALLKRSVVFLHLLNSALRLARPYLICLRIIILRLARLYTAIVRFKRFGIQPNRKKNRFKIKSLLEIESEKNINI